MSGDILFYVVFLSQIFLLSFFYAGKLYDRMRYVLTTYPPSEYPKLYPESVAHYENALRRYRNMNMGILLVGLLLVVGLLGYTRSGEWDRPIVFWFWMLQYVPFLLLEIGTFKYYKLMRKADARTTKKAELHRRSLYDFVSPGMLRSALFVYLAFILFILYIDQYNFPWFGGYWNIVGVTAGNLFFTGIIVWNIYGKKRDPYQAHEDRARHIEITVKSLVFLSIAMTVFVAAEITLASLDMRHLQPTITSLYLQIIAVASFRSMRLDDINFEVYKADSSVSEGEHALVDEEPVEDGKHFGTYVAAGTSFGLAFGIALALKEGATLVGVALLGGIGGGIGLILGLVLANFLDFRKGTSPMV